MIITSRGKFYGLAFLLTLWPTLVFANAGSPMMWFGLLHSLLLNSLIGWIESTVVNRYNIPHRTWIIIVGNYVSMFVGLYFIAPHFSTIAGNSDFWGGKTRLGDYELKGFIAGMGASLIATLIIELPFFYFSVKEKFQRREIFPPLLVANIITNLAMIIIYYWIVKRGGHW